MKQIFIILLLIFIIAACEDVFNAPPKAFLNATIRYTDDTKDDLNDSVYVSVTGVNMSAPWIMQDTLVKTKSDTTRTVLVPLNDTPNTDYIFVINELTDTIQILTDSELIYESMETGFYPEFKILDILHTKHRIDNIVVKDSAVTKEWNENIIININTDNPTNN